MPFYNLNTILKNEFEKTVRFQFPPKKPSVLLPYHSNIIKTYNALYDYLREFKFTKKLKIKTKSKIY